MLWLLFLFELLGVNGRRHHRRQVDGSCDETQMANSVAACTNGCFGRPYHEVSTCMAHCIAANMMQMQRCQQKGLPIIIWLRVTS